MRKFRFVALCFALVVSVSLVCSCDGKKDRDEDTKSEKSAKKHKDTALDNEVSLPSKDAPDMEDVGAVMDYLEAKAPSFFPAFNRLMQPIVSVLDGGETPADSDAEKLQSFVNRNEVYFEAIGALIGHESAGTIPESEQSRVQAFADKYEEGLTNVGILIGIGLMAEGQE